MQPPISVSPYIFQRGAEGLRNFLQLKQRGLRGTVAHDYAVFAFRTICEVQYSTSIPDTHIQSGHSACALGAPDIAGGGEPVGQRLGLPAGLLYMGLSLKGRDTIHTYWCCVVLQAQTPDLLGVATIHRYWPSARGWQVGAERNGATRLRKSPKVPKPSSGRCVAHATCTPKLLD